MQIHGASEKIRGTVTNWAGVTAYPHRFGGVEFRLGKRELGHMHGNALVDIPLPMKIRDELVAAGRVEPHHILPKSGWVSFYIREEGDIEKAIELLKLSFDIASQQYSHRTSPI